MSIARWLFVMSSCALVACQTAAPPAPVAPTTAPPAPSASPAVTDAPRAFATESRFRGECAPPGSRGGCDEYTFSPDGTASHLLYDARISGRYRIEGGAVVFSTSAPDAHEERLPLTENGSVLGGRYRLQP